MNVIEVLSNKYNFSMDEAVSLFAVKNKSKKTKKDGQSLEDMFAELVNDVEQDNREPVIVLEATLESAAVAPVVKEKKEKAKKQPLSEEAKKQKAEELIAAKEAAKKQKAEELIAAKEAAKKQKADDLLAQKEAAKKQKADELIAAKKQKADELLAQKEAAKKQKEDEKLAAKEAAKAAKAPKEPKAVKAVKEPKAVKAVKEPKAVNKEDSVDITDMPPIKITVTRVKIGDQTYLKSTAGILYNADTKEEVGLHDEATNTIKPLPEDGDEELEEDTYEA
jgi:hypothetical protein